MTPDTLPSVAPNQPKTPLRSFRYPTDKWERAKLAAADRGLTVTDVIAAALDALIDPPPPGMADRALERIEAGE